ncbi:sensor histidine kinase [Stutzerimonas azotifigens]|uniref:histidine kinase n=1 Tax=Stutzerimonas azotifigens TaxID=291995 RepID=A0ABR5Z6Q0_9GAMM|nr:PAS domain-containing protein [Stutzerimonas azotifigens]MBA1275900.1 PAS domain-containing protein [Stutzerimonas azotifigens]
MTALAASSQSVSLGGLAPEQLDLLPVPLWLCDRDGNLLHANPRAREAFAEAPVVGQSVFRAFDQLKLGPGDEPPALPVADALIDVLQRAQPIRDLELCQTLPDAPRRWLLMNAEPVVVAGEVVGATCSFQDISRQRRAEIEHALSQQYLQAIVDATPECVKVVAADGSLLQMNPAGLGMIGAGDAASVTGVPVLNLIAEEDRRQWQENHLQVCAGKRCVWEFDLISIDGVRRHMETHAVPLRLPDGGTGHLAVTRDITEQTRDRERILASERYWHALLEALPMAVYTTDSEGLITFYNAAAVRLWGAEPVLGQTRWCGSVKLFANDGAPLQLDDYPMAVALRTGTPQLGEEALLERPDGSRVPFAAHPMPLLDDQGRVTGAISMLVDISSHRQAQQRQALLIDELNHRVKNTLASVQSIAALTLRKSDSLAVFHASFERRLIALSQGHDLLTQSRWQSALLRSLLDKVLQAYLHVQCERVELAGPAVELAPREALSLAMAFHELTVNAATYGALSGESGQVQLHWQVLANQASRPRLSLQWREYNGPAVAVPGKPGFGTRLIEASVVKELGGSFAASYDAQGFSCTLELPLTGGVQHV